MTFTFHPLVQTPCLATDSQRLTSGGRLGRIKPEEFAFVWIDRWHADRAELEAFIARVFLERYNATLTTFHDILMGCKNSAGEWISGLGFSALAHRAAFLEQYLDSPVEQVVELAKASLDGGPRITRWEIVEVGNLAALQPGASRALIVKMTEYLHRRHFRWVVFTATQSLINSFSKLHYHPVELAYADPQKLVGSAAEWGSYYHHSPRVMVGDVRTAYGKFFS